LAFLGQAEDFAQLEAACMDFVGTHADIDITINHRGDLTAPVLKCRNCGFELKPNWVKCPKCKTPVAVQVLRCQHCGEELEDWMDECPACGKAAGAETAAEEKPAESEHGAVLRNAADEAEKHLKQAQEYEDANNYEGAKNEYIEAIRLAPDNMDAYDGLKSAITMVVGGEDIDRKASLKEVFSTVVATAGPDNPAVLVGRARVYNETGVDIDTALEDLNKAIRLKPDFSEAFRQRGMLYRDHKENKPQALKDFNEAIRLAKGNHEASNAYESRAESYALWGDKDKALQDYTKAISFNGNGVVFCYLERGKIFSEQEDYASAIADFTQAIRLKPDDADSFFERGEAYWLQDNHRDALKDLNKAIELNAANADYFCFRGLIWAEEEEYEQAIADFTESINLDPEDGTAFYERGMAYMAMEDYTTAIDNFNEALQRDPDDNGFILQRGIALYFNDEYDRAIKDFTRVIQNSPKDSVPVHFRGSAYYSKGDYNRALQDLNRAVKLDPNDANNYRVRSNIYYQLGLKDQAKADCEQALRIAPDMDKNRFLISSDCFITTAVCQSFSKPDDCYELTAFRNFRDNWLMYQNGGKQLVEEYYQIAPAIVAAINKNPQKDSLYFSIWQEHLLPCLQFIEEGKLDKCKEKYAAMVTGLKKLVG
jgi:tetratricopeptide (TPR) repeat protein